MDCLVIGHRGASAAYPENTLAAFIGAATSGADWVELDVRLTADEVAVVHHDPDLADGRPVADLVVGDLPASVPTLASALATCHQQGLGVNIEIKSDPRVEGFDPAYPIVDRALAVVSELADPGGSDTDPADARADESARYLVTSFDPGCLDAVRDRCSLRTGQLVFEVSDVSRMLARIAGRGHASVNPWDPYVDAAFVTEAHDRGLQVFPWTVDDPDRMRVLVDLGVDGIITNVPDVLRPIVG